MLVLPAPQGLEGNPTIVNTTPAMNLGTAVISTVGSTGSLSVPGVSLPGSNSSSSGTTNFSLVDVTVSADNMITRGLFRNGMKVMNEALQKHVEA